MFFPTLIVSFLAKTQKTFKIGEITKFDEEREFFEKKTLSAF